MQEYRLEESPVVYYTSRKENAEWVLFIHAAFVNHNMFQPQIACFQDKYNLLMVDILGHGKSTRARKGDSIRKMSGWIRVPVQSLACFGGYDINNFDVKMQRENGASQMLMMLKAFFSVKWFARSNKKISAYTLQAQEAFYQMNLQFPKKSFRYLASLNSMVNTRQTGPRNYPLLIGCGRHDIPMELWAVEMWKKNEPECSVVVFEGAGHCVNMDTPDEFNAAMEEFWLHGNCKG